ncbi:Cytochrome P450 [Sesbania bispinosa]|nr:Cytochrome P450 [Sesbania bispinosa]
MEMVSTVQVVFGAVLVLLIHVLNVLVLKPRSLRAKLQRQGIHGPSPHFYLGPLYLFSTGNIQWLMVADIEIVKEMIMNTSLVLGKPSYHSKDLGPLLGRGILSSSGLIWAHQRKIIAPELYLDKVKAMIHLIVDSTKITLRSWETKLENKGAVSEIKVDDDLRSLSADIISRACFGSNYIEGKEIFTKLRDLQKLLSHMYAGIPGLRYLPNKRNRQVWKLEKEINSKISKLIKQRMEESCEKDLLQMILEGAKNYEDSDGFFSNSISRDTFIIDNCKNMFFAGHETTAITSSWCLMLLAINQDWQDRVRAELTMVIQETLRLYPTGAYVVRTAYDDINLKGILIPKGMNIQIPIAVLQHDPELWGPDVHKFNPQRFANGVLGACKIPQAFMPFGIGARICVGQHLAMIELKVILSLILLKFRFTLSSSYCHSPAFHLVIEPGQGVVLNMTRI